MPPGAIVFLSGKHAAFSLTMIHPDDVTAAAIRQSENDGWEQFKSAGLFIHGHGSGLTVCFVFI
jgi:hypothetical protein